MEYNRFWELLAKVNAGEASPEEQLEFNQALIQSTEYQGLAREINVFWKTPLPPAVEIIPQETSRKWEQIRKQIRASTAIEGLSPQQLGRKRRLLRLSRMCGAAAALAAIVFFAWWSGHSLPWPGKMNVVSTRYGSKTKVELPDGTQVWLNGGSRIVYKENYDIEDREIQLEGEAFFDVVHNASRPFVIHTRDMDVKVLGTSFNIQAYPGDKTSEASLIKGSIEISFPGRPREKLILKPNEKITIVHSAAPADTATHAAAPAAHRDIPAPRISLSLSSVTYQPADSSILETAWTTNKLVFRSKPFEDIARDMERWYNTTIQCSDSAILNRRFTGTFNNETVTEALDALQLSYPFRYRFDIQNNIVIITSR